MNTGRIITSLLVLLVFCLHCEAAFTASAEADSPSGRILYVGKGAASGNGLSASTPLPTITAALSVARSGDTIRVAPGSYAELLRIPTRDLRIEGAYDADNVPLVEIVPSANAKGVPLLRDSHNTIWTGIAFRNAWGSLGELDAFTGTFNHCLFSFREFPSRLGIRGGSPTFFACAFTGSKESVSTIDIMGKDGQGGAAEFAYCLFRDFGGGAVFLKKAESASFTNCLFVNCRYALLREDEDVTAATFVNTAFYLMSNPILVRQAETAPLVRLRNCLYAPAPNNYLRWKNVSLEKQKELDAQDCITASPRFKDGKSVYINLCIDDSINLSIWNTLCGHAAKYGLSISLAIDTLNMPESLWPTAVERINEGHEVVGHTVTHASLLAKYALRLSYYREGISSSDVTVDANKKITVRADGKEVFSFDLGGDAQPTMAELAQHMEESGMRAELSDAMFGRIPARLLSETTEQDIFFEAYSPSLVLDTTAFIHYSLGDAKNTIEQALQKYGAKNTLCNAIACPFSEVSPGLRELLHGNGYKIVRGRKGEPFNFGFETVKTIPLQDVSMRVLKDQSPTSSNEEMLRLILDLLKYNGGVYAIYSHGYREFSTTEWDVFFEVLSKESAVKVMPLADIAAMLAQECESVEIGQFSCAGKAPVDAGEVSFIPGADSPLIGGGAPTKFTENYYGKKLENGASHNIGIY